MTAAFPSAEWLTALCEKLNNDRHYGQVARNWEGDLIFDIHADGKMRAPLMMYLDLWHGQCRSVEYDPPPGRHPAAKFTLRSAYANFASILLGQIDPMTAMLTSKLKVDGSLAYMMRNVPTVLDFVRSAREITTTVL